MLKITTVPTKKYTLCGEDVKLNSPCRIDWGDGTITLIENLKQAKHKFKKKEVQTITVHDLNTRYLSFKFDEEIERIEGTLPYLPDGSLEQFFYHAFNLKYVDPNLFELNDHHTNLRYLCAGAINLKDISFIRTFVKARDISYMLYQNISRRSIDELSDWGRDVEIADYAFAGNPYMSSPRVGVLEAMEKLRSAKGLFKNNDCMLECYPYFTNNLDLEYIDEAFYGCPIATIDENWLYYLPKSIKTSKYNIFNKNIKINGM